MPQKPSSERLLHVGAGRVLHVPQLWSRMLAARDWLKKRRLCPAQPDQRAQEAQERLQGHEHTV